LMVEGTWEEGVIITMKELVDLRESRKSLYTTYTYTWHEQKDDQSYLQKMWLDMAN